MLFCCWASVADGELALKQHWFNVSCSLGACRRTLKFATKIARNAADFPSPQFAIIISSLCERNVEVRGLVKLKKNSDNFFSWFSNFLFSIQNGPGPTNPLSIFFLMFGIFLTLQPPLVSQ